MQEGFGDVITRLQKGRDINVYKLYKAVEIRDHKCAPRVAKNLDRLRTQRESESVEYVD